MFFSLMERCCKVQIGALNTEILAERVNSIANIIITDDSTLLSYTILNKLVTLQMNVGFMEHMREHYSAHIKVEQPFEIKIVRYDE